MTEGAWRSPWRRGEEGEVAVPRLGQHPVLERDLTPVDRLGGGDRPLVVGLNGDVVDLRNDGSHDEQGQDERQSGYDLVGRDRLCPESVTGQREPDEDPREPGVRTRIAGAMASTVITMMMSTAEDGLFNPLTFTLTLDEAASNEMVMRTSEAQGSAGPETRWYSSVTNCHLPQAFEKGIPCLGGIHPCR